jgi:addiction module antitoxin, relB/dinJ family
MAQTSVNIRMDEDLKKQFDNFCSDVGMSMTTAFCIFAKTVVRERRIPFEIRTNEPNETTYAAMESAVSGEDIHGPFTSVSEVMEALNA